MKVISLVVIGFALLGYTAYAKQRESTSTCP
jgi:hypothetical protein